jgi:hypothetical protein
MARITAHAVDAKRTAGEELVGFCLHATLAILVGLLLAPLTSNGIVRLLSSLNVHCRSLRPFLLALYRADGPFHEPLCPAPLSVVDWSDLHPVHSHRSCLGLRRCWTLGLLTEAYQAAIGETSSNKCLLKMLSKRMLGPASNDPQPIAHLLLNRGLARFATASDRKLADSSGRGTPGLNPEADVIRNSLRDSPSSELPEWGDPSFRILCERVGYQDREHYGRCPTLAHTYPMSSRTRWRRERDLTMRVDDL